jgi:uncharacterized protein (TIGR04255 family)
LVEAVFDRNMRILPEFDRPPVAETVLSIQFASIQEMRSVHFGLFWQKVRAQYPITEERPALPPVTEQIGEASWRGFQPRFEVRETVKPERVWFLNETRTELIQLQTDRFIKNWRKGQPDDVYPRYVKSIKPGFERDFGLFKDFLNQESLSPAVANQCEVTYVNHIVCGEGWSSFSEAANIFSFLADTKDRLEDARFILRFPVVSDDKQVGRLNVEIQPAFRESDKVPMYVMSLTARGMLGRETEFFELGREAIVLGFVNLTTPKMHEIWGRTR